MTKRLKVAIVVGARPNFMKAYPILREMRAYPDDFLPLLVHTGQHYDYEMSKAFFDDLSLPEPDFFLEVGSGSHAEQTAKVMRRLEKVLKEIKPDLTIVVGDVNSTLASAIVASKMFIKVAHIEAGLRSFDRTMPEEINRVVTDQLSDYLFVTEESGVKNLLREGIQEEKIFLVGNVMIDTLINHFERIEASKILNGFSLRKRSYALLTLHRPSNVDNLQKLSELMEAFLEISKKIKIIFPVHPRTMQRLKELKFPDASSIVLTEPLKYTDFVKLEKEALFVLTDSGGIQEETTFLKVPCITLRERTERPITVKIGTNIVVGTNKNNIVETALKIMKGEKKEGEVPPLWDGKASSRIVNILREKKEEIVKGK